MNTHEHPFLWPAAALQIGGDTTGRSIGFDHPGWGWITLLTIEDVGGQGRAVAMAVLAALQRPATDAKREQEIDRPAAELVAPLRHRRNSDPIAP